MSEPRVGMEIAGLVRDLTGLEQMLWVIGGGDVVSENTAVGMKEPEFSNGYVNIEAEQWHIHLNADSVKGVQFVEAEDHGIPFLYYVRFSDAQGETLFRVYFPNPYLDDHDKPAEFQPEKLKVFEDFRDRHVGRDGIIFAKRPRQ